MWTTWGMLDDEADTYRVIFSHDGKTPAWMICRETWNGVNSVPSAWDGKLTTASAMYQAHWSHPPAPEADWLVCTLCYHM